jgi:hypothetical protein
LDLFPVNNAFNSNFFFINISNNNTIWI